MESIKIKSLVRLVSTCLLLLLMSSTTSAYTLQYYWDPSHVGYAIDNSASSYESSILSAASAWTNAGADFDYFWSINSDNKIYYMSLGSPLGICQRYIYTGTNRLSRWNIKINSDISWSTSDPCADDCYDIQSTLTHELGHGVGLNHSSVQGATMWPTGYPETTWKRTLSNDDKDGIIATYGTD